VYDELAPVYEWTVPEALTEPPGAVAAFAAVVEPLPAAARVLDCACGTGQLAVGLAEAGHDVVATDASAAMVERTAALAAARRATVPAQVCAWEDLPATFDPASFDAVFCVGNSITHAGGRAARQRALAAMASLLRRGGTLALTTRNWELVRRRGPGIQVGEQLVHRGGRAGVLIHDWHLPNSWEEEHRLDLAVALLDADGGVTTYAERLPFWPFAHGDLLSDLRHTGLEPAVSTYDPEEERYLVTATKA
jgi:SAM-dependent methyltransferase